MKNRWILLILILLLGFSLRLYDLDKESLWFDEAITVNEIKQDKLSDIIKSVYEIEGKPPSDYIMLHYWGKLFGLSVFALRFFYLIFGVLGIYVLYLLGKELFNEKVGLISSFLMSISAINILYSQELRAYTSFVFWTLLSYLYFTRVVKKDSNYIHLSLVNAFTNTVHYFGIINMGVQNIIMLVLFIKKKISLKKWIYAQILPSFAFLISIKPFLVLFVEFHYALQSIFMSKFLLPFSIAQFGILLFMVPFIILFFISFLFFYYADVWIKLYDRMKKKIVLPIIILVWILFFVMAMNILLTPSFFTRYSIFMVPFFYLALSKMFVDLHSKKKLAVYLIIITVFASFILTNYYIDNTKEEWKEVALFVKQNENSNDIIMFDFSTINLSFNHYYGGNAQQMALSQDKTSNLKVSNKGIWLILSHNWKTGDFYLDALKEIYNLKLQKSFKGIKLYYFET
tara:strand:+ start:428 stop:1798 length:1371 start_codon:yes stop_codon:yes gene_type:complete